ncbi:MAG TPA: aspartate kinase [Gaiellaceae bacterium]
MNALPEPAVETVVMKFGGSSVSEPEHVKHVARRLVGARERGFRVVGTISAMGRTTDSLLELAHRVSPNPAPRELDMLLSTGERTACALVAIAINALGHEAVSFTGSQAGILTDAIHTKAKIREVTPVRVLAALDEGKIVLVAGFQGFTRDTMDVTTLGRGGTDVTAVALAAALGASCEIYSDVPGVFTADPRLVPEARKLTRVSYEEMLEMAGSGAKVLMLRAVEIGRRHRVRIHARSTFTDEPGTWIQGVEMEQPIISAVTHSDDEVVFTLTGIPDRPGSASVVFDAVADEHVNVDTILQNVVHGVAELSFSVPREDVPATRRAVAVAKETLGPMDVEENDGLGRVSLIGAGMRSHPGVAAKMFRTLADAGINLQMISTSPIRISCMIDRSHTERAVRALHDAFHLGEAAGEFESAPPVK